MRLETAVVVIGGGPAGAAAAAVIAKAGLPTTLLVGAGGSRWVETVPPGTAGLLAELGLSRAALASLASPCRWHGAERVGLHVDRSRLDPLLREVACRSGASVRHARATGLVREAGHVAGIRTACGSTVPCRTVIDASGSRAWLTRRLGLRTHALTPPLIAWRGETGRIPDGMVDRAARFWPHEDGWLFQATWRGRTTWTAMGSGRRPPAFARLDGARPAARSVGWRLARPLAAPRWFLAGEAAGRLDPAWGEGLLFAVLSGIAAARAAVACLTDPAREAVYLAAYDGWFADRIHAAAAGLRQRYAENGIRLIAEPAAIT
jgi:flavin-dependent dehydrogenase